MISNKELQIVDPEYFNIIQTSGFSVSLQSKNTKHYWHIAEEEFSHFRHFKVYHKHNSSDEYHRHKDASTLKAAIKKIMEHDTFHLNGRTTDSH